MNQTLDKIYSESIRLKNTRCRLTERLIPAILNVCDMRKQSSIDVIDF
jgi:hypothetical protein